jgi:alpha-beta hydrolase superfamily lysophospholipase
MWPVEEERAVIESVPVTRTTAGGVEELERSWRPVGEPWAEVVVVHGLGEHSGRYEHVGSQMAEAGLAVRSFDLVGQGATGGRRADVEDWSVFLDQVETHVSAALASGRPVVLYGHSMGGLIALEYILSERPRPALAVLSAPALFGGAAWQRALAPIVGRLAPTLTIPNKISGEQLSRDPAVGAAYFADPLVQTKSTGRLGAGIFAAMERCRGALDRLQVPTLVVHGGADTVVPATASLPLAGLAGVERRLYPKLRHETHNEPEGPEVLAETIEWVRAHLAA